MDTPFHRDNHYVPRLYLKRWSSSYERVWAYRTLVSSDRVRPWKESSIKGVAYHSHLYTRIVAGQETDELERWFEREFETPAEEAIIKATSDERLTPGDWKNLVRFLAVQDVRTPARFADTLRRWETELPKFLDRTMKETVRKLEVAKASGIAPMEPLSVPNRASFPLRVTSGIEPGQDMGWLKGEIVAGRALWLYFMPHQLTETAKVLHNHRWTILSPPKGMTWFTSDNPVIRLNFSRARTYDFGGGWANPGTHLFLPLGPRHLLYTEVGSRPPDRGFVVTRYQSEFIRRCIAEHANRMIFAAEPDVDVPKLRPRRVDAKAFAEEAEGWRKWHEEQAAVEREFMNRPK